MTGQNLENQTEGVTEVTLPHTVTLRTPIPWGKDETVKELVFTRGLKAKDLKHLQPGKTKLGDMYTILARLVNQPIAMIDELESADLFECMEVVNSFLPAGLMTGDSH